MTTSTRPAAALPGVAAAVAVLVLLLAPAAAAHGGGGSRGYTSTITSVSPERDGLDVEVRESDDRLYLRNGTGTTVVILGYEGEPYLEFRTDGVYQNSRSPATYLNDDRFGEVDLPATADPKAPPAWERVSPRSSFEWHDHRIHWMSETPPPKVAAAEDRPHHVFDWTVPGTMGREKLQIAGSLDYAPPPGQSFPVLLLVPLVALAVLGALAVWLRRRRLGRS
jgi:hypothetical protein